MAFSANIVTVAEMRFMAGENRDATGDVDANHIMLQDQAEAYLSTLVKFDIATNFGTLNAVYKILFTEWAARYSGMTLITFNMAGYTSRVEAEDMINVHIFRMNEIKELLNNSSIQDFQGV